MCTFTALIPHEKYMERCLSLAKLGAGAVSPNPMVGAVLVYEGIIIGEGYHAQFGYAHAEVNCIQSVAPEHKRYIAKSTLYVSLEPCAHYGKTPACTELIIEHNIPSVVVGCSDSFAEVNGKGIAQLRAANVQVIEGVLANKCKQINKHFFTFTEKRRPYIYLKYAQTANGYIAENSGKPIGISNPYTSILTHSQRAACDAILVGTNTILHDNPLLTTRHWIGPNPTRIIIDLSLRLPLSHAVFNTEANTVLINSVKTGKENNIEYYQIEPAEVVTEAVLNYCYNNKLTAIIVEGGAITLQHFITNQLWDEALIITHTRLHIPAGIQAPALTNEILISEKNILANTLQTYKHNQNEFL